MAIPPPENAAGSTISAGPYQGFRGIITPYNITVTARSRGGAEVRMRRTLQTVAVPVFQFGLFSENDLSFFAGPNFNFGGRVHTNANLFLASGNGTTLTLADRVTAVGEVIRTNLSNGWDTNTNYTGTVQVIKTAPSTLPQPGAQRRQPRHQRSQRPERARRGRRFLSAPMRATSVTAAPARGVSICRWCRRERSR